MVTKFRTKCSEQILTHVDKFLDAVNTKQAWPDKTQFFGKLVGNGIYTYHAVLPNGAELVSDTRWDRTMMDTAKDVGFEPDTNCVVLIGHLNNQRVGQLPMLVIEVDGKWVTITEVRAAVAAEAQRLSLLEKSWKLPKLEDSE